MKECNLYIATEEKMVRGAFDICEVEDTPEGKQKVTKFLFQNNGDLADDFGSIGIIYSRINKGQKVMLIRHPDDKFEVIE